MQRKGINLDKHLHESVLLLVERDEQLKSIITTNCTFGEMHGVAISLIGFMADHAEISYNQMLQELTEVNPEIKHESDL